MKLKSILVLWPSFLVAGIVNSLFFTLFDPLEMTMAGEPLFDSRVLAYSVGFFVCWLFAGLSSGLTLFFERDREQVNRYCPVDFSKPEGERDGGTLAH
ncbi:hypothetical protein QWZ03_10885 [Chitinimonas viridis]|uniref:Uncharacterized protein n=2 Tax=Chitinimonas TaxID=240411 RepID=A0ABT8B671_9NEIS|nr:MULTISPECIES: hypothetical protein [Chitinimonas]MDN3577272.1 hypothetical protein [Chitinimonas viridis]GLR13366.1 hypothetical protein GCM10007907_21560 [Chitinimonas prasina]